MHIENNSKAHQSKYPPIKESQRYDANFMIEIGLQPPLIRNIEWKKSKEEKEAIKIAKALWKGGLKEVNTKNLHK